MRKVLDVFFSYSIRRSVCIFKSTYFFWRYLSPYDVKTEQNAETWQKKWREKNWNHYTRLEEQWRRSKTVLYTHREWAQVSEQESDVRAKTIRPGNLFRCMYKFISQLLCAAGEIQFLNTYILCFCVLCVCASWGQHEQNRFLLASQYELKYYRHPISIFTTGPCTHATVLTNTNPFLMHNNINIESYNKNIAMQTNPKM